MGEEDLTEPDRKLFEYIRGKDFVTKPWATPEAASALGTTEEEVYKSLSNLAKHMKGRFYIYYREGALRVVAE